MIFAMLYRMSSLRITFLFLLIFLLAGCNGLSRASSDNEVYSKKGESTSSEAVDSKIITDLTQLNEVSYQIHEDIPAFVFKTYYRGNESEYTSDLHVYNTQTNELVLSFDFIEYLGYFCDNKDNVYGIENDIYTLEFVDVNFDGYKDLQVFAFNNGNWNKHYVYFIWDSNTGSFVDDYYGLSGLGLPSFDGENQLIRSMSRGSASDHWYYTHEYIDGKLTLVEEVAHNRVWDYHINDSAREKLEVLEPLYDANTMGFWHLVIAQLDLNTMEMIEIENKFILYDTSEMGNLNLLSEYGLDSDVGLILRNLPLIEAHN